MSPSRQATPLPQLGDSPEEVGGRGTCDSQPADEQHIAPSQTVTSYDIYSPPSDGLTLSPIKNIDTLEDQSRSGHGGVADAATAPEEGSVSPPRIRQQVELPGLKALNLPHTLDQESSTATAVPGQRQASSDGPVAKAAMEMINALARNLNKTSKRQAEQDNHSSKTPIETATTTTAGTNTDSLSDSQKKFLSTVLSAALEKLGQTPSQAGQADNTATATNRAGSDEPDSKQEGYQCDVCFKWKRLKCELK